MAILNLLQSSWSTIAAAALLAGVIVLYRRNKASRESLHHIQVHEFADGNNSAPRYVTDSKALLHEGYVKYTKYGIPFRMRNPVDPEHPQVILPWKYLDEVRSAPQNRLSFPFFSRQAFLLDYSNAPQQTDAAAHVIKTDLNKNLASQLAGMHEESELALKAQLPECKDWTPFQPYMALAYTVCRVSSRVLAGTELCRNDEWVQMGIRSTIMVHGAAQEIRQKYSPPWRWLARWRHPGSKAVLADRRRAAELLVPVVKKRLASADTESGDPDAIQWFLAAAGNRVKDVQELADEQLFLSIASTHTTTASTLSILYDLLDHPDAVKEIMEEIQPLQAELGNGPWTRQALSRLEKLDSFMKESQRMNPIGLVTIQRSAVKSYVFKDGFRIPQHTQTSFPNYELNMDADVYEKPEQFEPWRFLKMRRAGDPNKFHFTYVSEHSINFGAGTHACPGRFFVSYEVKMILIYLFTRYDVQWPKGQSRPPNMVHDFAHVPNTMASIMLREKN